MADTEVDEDSSAVFICEINYADEGAEWLLNDKVLFTNEINTITHEGKVHKLLLKNLAPDDGGTITFKVRKVTESVTLKVKGKNCHSLSFQAHKKDFSLNLMKGIKFFSNMTFHKISLLPKARSNQITLVSINAVNEDTQKEKTYS